LQYISQTMQIMKHSICFH